MPSTDMTIQRKPNFILFPAPAFYRLASQSRVHTYTTNHDRCSDTVLSPSTNDVDSGVCLAFWFFFFPLQLLFIYTYMSRFVIIFSFRLHMHLSRVWSMVLHLLFTSHCHLFPCMTDSDSFALLCSGTHALTRIKTLFYLFLIVVYTLFI
ncbi:hypothetical protein EDD22DRAFT_513641 [Suillus occidentalis]|nr:hypothetical protein EDD22DRAFT_513641 [Suillus occidentalis]